MSMLLQLSNSGVRRPGESGYGPAGAVVGATYPEQLRQLRTAMPHAVFLVPGFGAQGGTADDVVGAFDENGLGAVVNSSRQVIFAYRDAGWQGTDYREAPGSGGMYRPRPIERSVTTGGPGTGWSKHERSLGSPRGGATMKAVLVLEDGSAYYGTAIGKSGEVHGEVVFNTSMTGYQEILTDPSSSGEIITMTYPLIGNYGVNAEDFQSKRIHARGIIVHEMCSSPNNWRSRDLLNAFLVENGVCGIAGVDTRALSRHLREHGTMRGIISSADASIEELAEKARSTPSPFRRRSCGAGD